ncbi:MAG: InlB B-repeat-containing protein [Bacteroidales bacterium]|nr:InlB B-repeat-containing protein [Bacteroidales bacterium]MCM1416052.1 InlB B-repeat-containing protein [bacterium]MCM1424178.1 InlB B-repeat-containing protein [bacterium]
MVSGKRVLLGKRILTGILTAAMLISPLQLSGSSVWAAELPEDSVVTDSGTDFETEQTVTEDEGAADSGEIADPAGEDQIGGETAESDGQSEEEDNPADRDDESSEESEDDSSSDNETVSENDISDESTEEIEEEQNYLTGISENSVVIEEQPEVMVQGEIEGAYQFGGAPSARGDISLYSNGSLLSAYGEGAEEYLYEQMLLRSAQIDISAYEIPYDDAGKAALKSLVSGVLNEHPDLYFVENGYQYWSNGTIITALDFTYNNTYDDAAFQKSVTAALSQVNGQMSDLEKAIVLHDYLTVNCEYDYDNLNANTVPSASYTAYGILVNRIAVCQGYALAYKYLLNREGIDCYMVTSDSMNHAWNMIVLNGTYYQVDVTWDDPTRDRIGRSVHTYMFRSDAAFAKHQDWRVTDGSDVVNYTATDTRYDNAFWADCDSPLVFDGEDCYYITFDSSTGGVIKKGTLAEITGSGTVVQSIDRWPVWDGGGYWQGAFSGLFRSGDRLYYNDKSFIYSIALDGTDKRTEFTPDTTEGYIYGSAYCQGKVLYVLHQTPNITAKETVLTADLTIEGGDPVETPETYTITYILSGGKNSAENPSTYTAETETITLQDAVKDGYQFDGWYKDAAYTQRVTQIVKGSTGNLTLYAKWSKVQTGSLPEVDMTPSDGNVVMGFSGTYYTETADKILKRLNAIRLEACKEGIENPGTGDPLTEADYVPLKWSSDLEAIARLRAAEASVSQGHTRPNGTTCFTAKTTNGEQSWAENLAWNYDGLMKGIEQWYAEKSYWKSGNASKAGHYTSIISPYYRYVGMGTFRLSSGGWYSVSQEFSYKNSMDESKDASHKTGVQYLEIQGSKVTKLAYGKDKISFLREGDSAQMPITVTAQYNDYYGTAKTYTGAYQAGGSWKSSDETVAVVDGAGEVTALKAGTAKITMKAGTKSVSADITVYGKDDSPIVVKAPNRTTYKVGEKINLAGGTATYPSGSQMKTVTLTAAMISGFDSTKPGICKVQVKCGGYVAAFETLIVEEPKLAASVGQKLRDVKLPQDPYGTYTWQDDDTTVLEKAGVYTFKAAFAPEDTTKFQNLADIKVEVTAQATLGTDTDVTFKTNQFTYSGAEQEPKLVVRAADTVLTEGSDYTLSYENNKNAGTATVTIDGMGCYLGSLSRTFEIKPAQLVITAKDKTILIRDPKPQPSDYAYEVSGLMAGDALIAEPIVSCEIVGTAAAGQYDIVLSGADAGANYEISYVSGTLRVASEYVTCTVKYDMQGHGEALADQLDVKVGSTLEPPTDPTAEGYRFDGWYRDAGCTKAWNFDADIVQSDMTLYAKWLGGSAGGEFAFQEIADVYYTGKACKPAVSVYDGDTLLKAGRDYQIKYYQNVNANKDGVRKQGNGAGSYFKEDLPYVEIIGKGNYTDKVKVNFNIFRASIGDGSSRTADGVTLKVSDQLVTAKKVQRPFSSIKYVKGMKKDVDFTVSLKVENARDQAGKSLQKGLELENAAVPAGYSGAFLLTVKGIGNYEGSVCREIYVTDKAHLIKNATITIGKNLKNITFDGKPVELKAAESNSPDTFSVKYGKTFLKPGRDYTVSCRNHDRVGKAELVITGMGEYVGSKSAAFTIKGRAFTAKTVLVEGIENQGYTGKAITQNGVKLTYGTGDAERQTLRYGTDYTISYSKNINRGTATMTFKGAAAAGYSGSFKKTFKITAADITQTKQAETMKNMVYPYCKAGVKPVEEIGLTNAAGQTLRNGKDYTLKYANNKAVAGVSDEKPPTVTVKGKGNYAGEIQVNFTIVKADLQAGLDSGSIAIKTTPIAYRSNQADIYVYKPAVKLTDGKTALRAGQDYEIEYLSNTQADYNNYMQKLGNQTAVEENTPRAVITAHADSGYKLDTPIVVPLQIYQVKLKKADLEVEIGEAVYTGGRVEPSVKVSYLGADGKVTFVKDRDYTVSYGANNKSGKNKGSVTINGIAPYYGGSVTVKFDIVKKAITY